jgi:hypothetical protein
VVGTDGGEVAGWDQGGREGRDGSGGELAGLVGWVGHVAEGVVGEVSRDAIKAWAVLASREGPMRAEARWVVGCGTAGGGIGQDCQTWMGEAWLVG